MIHTHMPQSSRFRWLAQLASLASGLVLATAATAGSVNITGTVNASCASWSSVSGDGNNITYTCGTAQASGPGQFTLNVPGSLAANATLSPSTVTVTRASAGATATASVTITASGGCTSSTGTLDWTAGQNSTQPINLVTTTGTCTVAIGVPAGGTTNGAATKAVTLVDPAAPVVFAFELATIPTATFGASTPTVIKVKRSGGTDGDWAVPVTIAGVLTNAAAGSTTASAGSTTSSFSFPANSSEAYISFAPVAAAPVGLTLPATGTVTLGVPTAGAGVPVGQTAAVSPVGDSRTFSLNAPSGCVVANNVVMMSFNSPGNPNFVSLAAGSIASAPMPTSLWASGNTIVGQSTTTSQNANIEIWFSKCPGALVDPIRDQIQTGNYGLGTYTPCKKNLQYNGGPISWNKTTGNMNTCKLSDADGPYYMNYRHVFSSGSNSCPYQTCANFIQISNPN